MKGVRTTKERIKPVVCGTYTVDLDRGGAIISCDDNFLKMTGYDLDTLVKSGTTFIDLVPKEDHSEYIEKATALQEKGGGAIEHRITCADGSHLVVICIGINRDEGGRHLADITISDITAGNVQASKYVHSQAEIDLMSDSVGAGLAVYKFYPDGRQEMVERNDEFYRIFRIDDTDERDSFPMRDALCKEDVIKLLQAMKASITDKSKMDVVLQLRPEKGGNWIRVTCSSSEPLEDGSEMIYCTFYDVTESRAIEKELKKQSLRFQMIAENSDQIFFEYDVLSDTFTSTSRAILDRFGTDTFYNYNRDNLAQKHMHPDFVEPYNQILGNAVSHPTKGTFDYRTDAFDDEYHWYRIVYVSVTNERDIVSNMYGMIYSIEHMKEMSGKIAKDKVEIERLSNSDHVTGLLTRAAFTEKASQLLHEKFPEGGCFAIGYSDINDFSYVNENFGYEAGDKMLYDFAEEIRQTPGMLCASRIYSDYFITLCRGESREQLIQVYSERNSRFNKSQKEKYPLSDVQVSSGIYFIREGDEDMPIAIDNANLARRSIKGTSDVPCGIYTDRMRKKRSHDQAIASQIWNAINSGAIELFLQPKFDLYTRKIIGAEALTRWRNPDGSYKLPYEFISVLENVGYITQVDLYIYEQVLKYLKKWKEEGKPLIPISVNFSRKHNNRPNFVDNVNALAEMYGVEKSLIEIEVTESCFTQDVKNFFSNMRRLRDEGFKIDIDDFGTGYSSLSVLIDAPVDIVKVDKVFIDNIENDEKSRAYIAQICNLIQSTSKSIIFEGVETEEQAKILLGSGHSMAQGWLFDKAIPVDEFEKKYLS